MPIKRRCVYCGKAFPRYSRADRVFCSAECRVRKYRLIKRFFQGAKCSSGLTK